MYYFVSRTLKSFWRWSSILVSASDIYMDNAQWVLLSHYHATSGAGQGHCRRDILLLDVLANRVMQKRTQPTKKESGNWTCSTLLRLFFYDFSESGWIPTYFKSSHHLSHMKIPVQFRVSICQQMNLTTTWEIIPAQAVSTRSSFENATKIRLPTYSIPWMI